MKKPEHKILVIDDEEAIRRSLDKILRYEGFEVALAANGAQGVNLALQEDPDLIFLDIKMPKMDGIEVLQTLIKQGNQAPVVMISGHGTIQTALDATRLGAFDFMEKPLDRERILLVCRNAIEKRGLQQENVQLKQEVNARYQMIGDHSSFSQLKERIEKVAVTNATVLITGESGTGKELIARAVHLQSGRKGRFVQVNCAAIPEELIESELFGHVKGAFTGAVQNQMGKFQQADGGTIFLDEVADMSLNTQAKVLRVLQEGEVEPVGAHETVKVNVRVISATNKNLSDMINRKTFREDLYFRLNVVPIKSIPLRDRRDDIPMLIEHFKVNFEQENNLKPRDFEPEVIEAFQRRDYRGNIRELKNLVERTLILGEDEVLYESSSGSGAGLEPSGPSEPNLATYQTLRSFKESFERKFLIAKLKQFNGNISKTAESIDTPRSNLYKKLEQYDIKVDRLQ